MEEKARLRGELANLTWSIERQGVRRRPIRLAAMQNHVKVFRMLSTNHEGEKAPTIPLPKERGKSLSLGGDLEEAEAIGKTSAP